MHVRLQAVTKKLQRAQAFTEACSSDFAQRFGPGHPYQVCFIRLGNKVRYAAEVVRWWAHHVRSDRELEIDHVERVIETEKWFLIGTLSVIEYSMPLLGERGSAGLRNAAKNGPFSKFLSAAESEKAIDTNERGLLEFLSRVRNDLIHRNGVSRESAKLIFRETTFELVKDEMIEGHWGMLADLGTLAIYSVASIIDCIEGNLVEDRAT